MAKINFRAPQLITSGNNCAMIAVDSQAHGGMSSSPPIKAKNAMAQKGQAAGKSSTEKVENKPPPPPNSVRGTSCMFCFFLSSQP